MKKSFINNLHNFLYHHKDSLYRCHICFCLLIIGSSFLLLYSFRPENTTKQIQEGIASEIIRFHVIANSDSEQDQALKLKVKEALTEALKPTLENAASIEEARTLLLADLGELEEISNEIIRENGYTYTASATLEHGYFPLKVYGDLSLPPGEYEAIRVELGTAKGKNWWCVMYPPLCFVDATYSVVPENSKDKLKYVLTDKEYNAIFAKKNVKVKVKFKLLPWLNKLIENE